MPRLIDLTGKTLSGWTVIRRIANSKSGNTQWLCRCRCGVEKSVRGTRLISDKSNSCYSCAVKTGHGDLSGSYWGRIQYSAIKRNIPFELTIEDAWAVFVRQGRKCAITDQPIVFAKSKRDISNQTASLDRIDSDRGYVLNNVQWLHKDINNLKSDLKEDKFIKLCRLVAQSPHTIWR